MSYAKNLAFGELRLLDIARAMATQPGYSPPG